MVSWSSKRHKSVTLSSMEAEYIEAMNAGKEAMHMRNVLVDLRMMNENDGPIRIYEDNKSCVMFSTSGNARQRTKHIDRDAMWLKQEVDKGAFKLVHVSSTDQLADIFTKNVSKRIFERAVARCYAQMGKISTSAVRSQKCVCTRCWVGRKTLHEVVYRNEMFT